MPCTPVNFGGRIVGIVCSRKPIKKCDYCGKIMTALCDYPIGYKQTCDRLMCDNCKTNIGYDIDVCQEHNNKECIEKTLKGGR